MRFPFAFASHRLMDAEPAPAGGAAPAPAAENTPSEAPAPSAETPAPAENQAGDGEAKPFLGNPEPAPETSGNATEKPAEITEQSFIDGIVKDENVFGKDENVSFDADMIKAIAPAMKECGITVDQANRLANALAKVQMDQAIAASRERAEYFKEMNREAVKKYTPNDFKQINAGIDRWFRPNGIMNHVIRNSEVGSDPEFLALMHYLGGASVQDGVAGASAGSGASLGDGNGIEGMSKIW